jgi:hypothetical protein
MKENTWMNNIKTHFKNTDCDNMKWAPWTQVFVQ